ncbi:hypothetical protein AAFC00_002185 [Neodothiora populina]|uniref:Mitochondrial K+-H+ exchange-related-domain-containing protein n=1 Tax=Neodothiora populina TaxID=2781224 RepID=A0ABR3PGK1_9PEZI
MRIFLLPISTRRTLIYCERVHQQLDGKGPSIVDRLVNKANSTWAEWESDKTGWKKKLTVYGNEYVFSRIPFEEWGLKTLPSSTADIKITEVLYPDMFLQKDKAPGVLETLAKERQNLHRQRMWYSVIGLPLTIPVGILPVIPNIPGFYLTFRAYSHWKALSGAKFLQALCDKSLVKLTPSKTLNQMYAAGLVHPTREVSRNARLPTVEEVKGVALALEMEKKNPVEDVMLLRRWNGKLLAEKFGLPGMELEIERAVEQVEKDITQTREMNRRSSKPSQERKHL